MLELPAWAAPVSGLGTGFLIGYAVRRSRLCSFGAIEDALIGHDWRRMKIFGLALAIAVLVTQAMVLAGWLDPAKSGFLPTRLPYVSVIAGSLLFGLGMSLVGTCAFGSLIRLGGGDIRSFVVVLVFSICAYAVLRGAFAPFRIGVLEQFFWEGPGGRQISFADLGARWTDRNIRMPLTIVIVAILAGLVLADRRLRHAPRLLLASVLLGI
ncbi:MAG: YeeE/YedE family protein, partial [Hyphomicrobiales bacterium]|nr:YeeE/YedE family protein [Hyphomicrobiales bacterium]